MNPRGGERKIPGPGAEDAGEEPAILILEIGFVKDDRARRIDRCCRGSAEGRYG
jgi:hypothetical protein